MNFLTVVLISPRRQLIKRCFELFPADRADYFIAGVTNTSSEVIRPVRGAYPLCGQYPGQVGDGATVTLHCSVDAPPGQYVIIQQPESGPGGLTICELEVYGCEA